jgi:hypothetical protein
MYNDVPHKTVRLIDGRDIVLCSSKKGLEVLNCCKVFENRA